MKKICLLFALSVLPGCINAGNYDIIPARNDIFTIANGYGISFYDGGERLVSSETIEENSYKLNESATAYKGYSVLSNKIYQKDYYEEDYVKPNKNGALNSSSLPHKFSANQKYKFVGEVKINGSRYRLIPSELDGFVFLIDDEGAFYRQMGQIKGGTLILLDSEFFPYPEDLKMVNISTSRSEQTKPIKGFDVKYDGVRMERIWFTYLDYSDSDGEKGTFENISFPNKPGLIDINGVGFRVLQADEDKIQYMVLKDEK